MNLQELENKLPEEIKPWARQYGPVLIDKSQEELKAWVSKVMYGSKYDAYCDLYGAMAWGDLVAEGDALVTEWAEGVDEIVEDVKMRDDAVKDALKILMSLAATLLI